MRCGTLDLARSEHVRLTEESVQSLLLACLGRTVGR